MSVIIELVAGNLAPSYAFTLERNGTVIDLTSATSVVMNIINARTGTVTGTAVALTVTTPASGLVQYNPLAAHFPSEGRYWGEVKITHTGALPETLNRYVDFIAREDFV